MNTANSEKTKKLTMVAMLCALSYVVMLVGRIPIVAFLKYDPKDVIIVIGGFIFGPMTALIISMVVSFVEMFTASDTGFIGLVMNVIASCGFACTAAIIYKKRHTMSGAVLGLVAGSLTMTALMLLWNYFLTPIFLDTPRADVAAMLVPVFLPFNLLKTGLNTAITLLIYKPVVTSLRKIKLLPRDGLSAPRADKGKHLGLMLGAVLLLATCILLVLALRGII